MTDPAIFDGHNDLILRLLRGTATAEGVAAGLPDGHLDLPRARAGGLGGGFFAVFVPSPGDADLRHDEMTKPAYALPLPEPLEEAMALDWTRRGLDALDDLARAGAVDLCRTADQVETALDGPRLAAVAHLEGAEAIDRDFATLETLHARGLRSLGPVWSRDTVWGHGVPFRFPSDPDIGPGLTEAGRALVAECNRLGVLVDLSHLNEKGFDDVARLSDAPLVASHSNAWAVTPHSRNLTDRQLDAVAASGGLVGINFASAFLRPDGRMDDDFGFDVVMRHLDHLIGRLGEDGVGFGSDFDGALVPRPLRDCAGLTDLRAALRAHGVDDALMRKLCSGNWLRILRATWRD